MLMQISPLGDLVRQVIWGLCRAASRTLRVNVRHLPPLIGLPKPEQLGRYAKFTDMNPILL